MKIEARLALLVLPLFVACVDEDAKVADAGLDAGALDAEVPDVGVRDGGSYAHVTPTTATVAATLAGDRWLRHWQEDIRPFWTMPEAAGSPEGNYPTYRGMNGVPTGSTDRRPRMIGRQIYAYSMGYLMTGDPRLLQLAHAGVSWLRAHAKDSARGGWYGLLDSTGHPNTSMEKLAQDTSYVMLGFSAYHFVTRDPDSEAEILAARDLFFDPTKYWDPTNKRIKDGLTADLSREFDVDQDDAWELVAELDAINAFLLLSQPVLGDAARREQFLADLRTLGETIIARFWQDGIFWGTSTTQGIYRSKHADFGHTLKSYWMLLQIDKRLPDHPFSSFVGDNVHTWVTRAFDEPQGMWAKRPTGPSSVEYGSDWWIYAEADQLAATLNLLDYRYVSTVAATSANWLQHYVDDQLPAREIISSINRNGARVYNWPVTDTAKCNEWKNGFHSTEHALVMYLLGRNLENRAVTLHFAVPSAEADTFIARPYTFLGHEVGRTRGATLAVDGQELRNVDVAFDGLY